MKIDGGGGAEGEGEATGEVGGFLEDDLPLCIGLGKSARAIGDGAGGRGGGAGFRGGGDGRGVGREDVGGGGFVSVGGDGAVRGGEAGGLPLEPAVREKIGGGDEIGGIREACSGHRAGDVLDLKRGFHAVAAGGFLAE